MPAELELSYLQEMAADRDLRTAEQARDRAKRRSLGDHCVEGGSIEALDPPSHIELLSVISSERAACFTQYQCVK